MSRDITITHNGEQYVAKIATIKRTMLGYEDHGILTLQLTCEGDGWGVGVGGYSLDTPLKDEDDKFLGRVPTAYGLSQVVAVMETVGVGNWEKVAGQVVLVLFPGDDGGWGGRAVGIAHLTDEKKVLVLSEHLEQWKASQVDSSVTA